MKSVGGLTLQTTIDILSVTYPCRYVESVTVHVGTNDVAKGRSDSEISKDTMTMLDKLRVVYPNARLFISGILPQKGKRLVHIVTLNERLLALCKEAGVVFIYNKEDFLAKDSFPSHLFMRDKYHLSQTGLGILLRGIRKARSMLGGAGSSEPIAALSPDSSDHFPALEASNPQGGRLSVMSEVSSRRKGGQSTGHPARREHQRHVPGSVEHPRRTPLSRGVSPTALRDPAPATERQTLTPNNDEVTPPHCPQQHPFLSAPMTAGPSDSAISGHPPAPMRNFFPLGLQQPFGHFQWPFNSFFPSPYYMNPSPYPFHGPPLMGR